MDIIDVLPKGNKTSRPLQGFHGEIWGAGQSRHCVESGNNTIEEYVDLIEDPGEKLSNSTFVEYVDYSPLAFKSDFF